MDYRTSWAAAVMILLVQIKCWQQQSRAVGTKVHHRNKNNLKKNDIPFDARYMNVWVRPAWSFSSSERAEGPRSPPECIRTPPRGCRWRGWPLRWCTAAGQCGLRSASPCSRSTSAPWRWPVESNWKRKWETHQPKTPTTSLGAFGLLVRWRRQSERLHCVSAAGSFTVRYIDLLAGLALLVCHLHEFRHPLAGLLPLHTFFF